MNENKLKLEQSAITIIWTDHLIAASKDKNMPWHYNYYQNLCKKDKFLKRTIGKISKDLDNSTVFQAHMAIVKNGGCLFLSVAPQVLTETNMFLVLLPSNPSDYQKQILKKFAEKDLEFIDIGVYNAELNCLESLMQEEDKLNRNQAYLLTNYIKKYESKNNNIK